ncbi:hypothetical protein HDZ31DRAFT_40556 [Schizophyllum fasciatum]
MSNTHPPVAAHAPQSLPSFASTFGTQPLPRPPPNGAANALPPLHAADPAAAARSRPSSEDLPPIAGAGRKRPRNDADASSDGGEQSGTEDSARASHVKIEDDHEQLEGGSPPERRAHAEDTAAATNRDAREAKLSKRRRTIGDAPRLNTDVRVPPDQNGGTPISPVVMGLPAMRNPADLDKVRPAALIGPAQPPPPSHTVSSHGHGIPPTHSLPPPPISFARRRAAQLGSGKKKPADLNISPREAHTPEQLQPAIQSAPPIPHGGQSSYGRFPMSIPRLPSVLGHDNNSRSMVTGQVPPTPTRFSLHRGTAAAPAITLTQPISNMRKSPPTPSVPISTGLVPPTPTTLRHPPAQDKAAFLAPFELFYDALNDSRQLKGWLAEQLQRSQALAHNLATQQERLADTVDALVDKRTAGMRAEIAGLQRRVEELEDELRYDMRTRGRRNGAEQQPYTFPPLEPPRHKPPTLAGWSSETDREHIRENQVSATRLEPPPPRKTRESLRARDESPRMYASPLPGAREVALPPASPPVKRPRAKRQNSGGTARAAGRSRRSRSPPSRDANAEGS